MLLSPRTTVKPYEYQWAFDYWTKAHKSHWVPDEISMDQDVQDFHVLMSPRAKALVSYTLKGFTQTEMPIADYWTTKVCRWFKIPEITMMAQTFGAFETIHIAAYSRLNDSLGINDYEAFLHDPVVKAKIDRLIETDGDTPEEIALSLAVFSAFAEGVSLFSSFAILLHFTREPHNFLKGMGKQISYSVRDESQHSEAGCRTFRQLIHEYPELMTDKLRQEVVNAAILTIKLEDDFLDAAFGGSESIEGLSPCDLKQFVRHRINTKLSDLGIEPICAPDPLALERMEWFDYMTAGEVRQDFFDQTPTTYASNLGSKWDDDSMWDAG